MRSLERDRDGRAGHGKHPPASSNGAALPRDGGSTKDHVSSRLRSELNEPTGAVDGLKERRRREAREIKSREVKRAQADQLLARWQERHRGDVYAMMGSAKLFTDIFGSADPLSGLTLTKGDAVSLKKAWHKLAAKLHPDRQRGNETATQVLAEEVFKALTMAYTKEAERIEQASSGKAFANSNRV